MKGQKHQKDDFQLKSAELAQIYSLSLELLKKSQNPDELLDALLAEYIRRFSEMPETKIIDDLEDYADDRSREKVRALMMFAQQAALLKENADIQTHLKQRNQELTRISQKLRQTNRQLKRLNTHYLNMLGFVSHELRSPLISILGFAELLDEGLFGSLNVEQQNSIQIIIRVTRNLIDMIRNYLDLAKIENGELVIHWKDVEMTSEILSPVIAELEGQLLAKTMKIVHQDSQKKLQDIHIDGDPILLKIVFMNVFSNAIKYGKPDTAILYNIVDRNDQYHFSIINEGEGVPKEKLDKIFEKFSQTVNYNPDLPRGTGLGLFNTRCIVKAHKGTIWAESEAGKWFKVCITLPKNTGKRPKFVKMSRQAKESFRFSDENENSPEMDFSPQ